MNSNDTHVNDDDHDNDESSMTPTELFQTLLLFNHLRQSGFTPIFLDARGMAPGGAVDIHSSAMNTSRLDQRNDNDTATFVVETQVQPSQQHNEDGGDGHHQQHIHIDDQEMPQLHQQPPQQDQRGEQAVEEAIQRSFALHQPYDWHMTLDNPAENRYMDLDVPLYTCYRCHTSLTTGALVRLLSYNQPLRCPSCNNDELECFCCMLQLVVNQSFHKIQLIMHMKTKQDRATSSLSNNLRLMTQSSLSLDQHDKEELEAMRNSIDDLFLNELVALYPLDTVDEDGASRECCIPFCDGKGKLVYCCPHHCMHIDCLMSHIVHADKEICPMCRDPFIMMMIYRIVAPRMHSHLFLGDSPYVIHPSRPHQHHHH